MKLYCRLIGHRIIKFQYGAMPMIKSRCAYCLDKAYAITAS